MGGELGFYFGLGKGKGFSGGFKKERGVGDMESDMLTEWWCSCIVVDSTRRGKSTYTAQLNGRRGTRS